MGKLRLINHLHPNFVILFDNMHYSDMKSHTVEFPPDYAIKRKNCVAAKGSPQTASCQLRRK